MHNYYVIISTHTYSHSHSLIYAYSLYIILVHVPIIYNVHTLYMYTHMHALTFHSEAVPPDVYRKKPMCMSQYDMYSKCRIPYPEVDRVRHTPISQSKHIIVIRNGHVRIRCLTVPV